MTDTIQLDTHYDCTRMHRINELDGPEHLDSLMPGTVILMRGWEHMRLTGNQGWATVDGRRHSHNQMWQLIVAAKHCGRKVSLIHVGAA